MALNRLCSLGLVACARVFDAQVSYSITSKAAAYMDQVGISSWWMLQAVLLMCHTFAVDEYSELW